MNMTEATMPYRRGRILALVKASNTNGISTPLLRSTLRGFGYKADEDTVEIDLAWLSRHGLVDRRDVQGIQFLRITARGSDVITGDLDFPGVQLIEE